MRLADLSVSLSSDTNKHSKLENELSGVNCLMSLFHIVMMSSMLMNSIIIAMVRTCAKLKFNFVPLHLVGIINPRFPCLIALNKNLTLDDVNFFVCDFIVPDALRDESFTPNSLKV